MTPSRPSPACERPPLPADVLAALVELTAQVLVEDMQESVTGASARGDNRTDGFGPETCRETTCLHVDGGHADTAPDGGRCG